MKRALTVAGSDSGGGAGIQADLKTFTSFGVYGMSVLTAITAQNTVGVQGVVTLQPDFVARQMDSVLEDIGTDAVKTGMLANEGIVEAVVSKITEYGIKNLVVDPVMVAKGGDHLLQQSAVSALKKKLLPVSYLVTPNLEEAQVLTGRRLDGEKAIEEAALEIFDLGVPYVLIKGGHREGDAVDILYDGEEMHYYHSPRYDTKNTHGTGCTFSAAITAGLALGQDIYTSVEHAKKYISEAIRYSLDLGAGHGPTNHLVQIKKRAARYEVIENINRALHLLKEIRFGQLIPETQTNLALALPYADSHEDVAAVPGRIIRWGDTFRTISGPEFGASKSMAAMVLTANRFDPCIRAAMNIRYSEDVLAACRKANFSMTEFVWPVPGERGGVQKLAELIKDHVAKHGSIPDIVFNRGGWGKEAHIEFFGTDAVDIAVKIKKVMAAMAAI